MRYVSIDIETTGLDPDQDQILQIAAVADTNPLVQIEHLPSFNLTLKWDRLIGSPVALAMNVGLLRSMESAVRYENVVPQLIEFLQTYADADDAKVTAAGKNYASFDHQFLRRLDPRITKLIRHRVLDPGSMYVTPEDTKLPGTEECLRRMYAATGRVQMPNCTHDALDDARQICRLIRHKLGGRVY